MLEMEMKLVNIFVEYGILYEERVKIRYRR